MPPQKTTYIIYTIKCNEWKKQSATLREQEELVLYQDVALFDVNVSDIFLYIISNQIREIGSIAITY